MFFFFRLLFVYFRSNIFEAHYTLQPTNTKEISQRKLYLTIDDNVTSMAMVDSSAIHIRCITINGSRYVSSQFNDSFFLSRNLHKIDLCYQTVWIGFSVWQNVLRFEWNKWKWKKKKVNRSFGRVQALCLLFCHRLAFNVKCICANWFSDFFLSSSSIDSQRILVFMSRFIYIKLMSIAYVHHKLSAVTWKAY